MAANLRSWAASSALIFVLGSAAACGEDKKVPAAEQDAGAADTGRKQAALGGKLAAAVKAAESAQAPAKAQQDGPPEKGVFAPGAADKVLAPGAPPKIDVLGEGADPKVALAPAIGDDEQKESISVAVRLGPQSGAINVEYGLAYKVEKPKDKAKDDKDKKDAREPVKVSGKIVSVTPAAQIPRDLAEQIGKIKGTEIRWTASAERGATDVAYAMAKGADSGLTALLNPLVEAIGLSTPPLPAKPVGVGAYWMVTDRVTSAIVDVVRYRVFRVEKIEKDRATLSMEIRQYAVKNEVDAGGGQKLAIDQFESTGKGRTEWTAQGLLPANSEAQVRMGVAGRIQTGQQGMLQTDFQAKMHEVVAEKAEKKK